MSGGLEILVGKGMHDREGGNEDDAGGDDNPDGGDRMDEEQVNLGYAKRLRKAIASSDDAGIVDAMKKLMASCGPDEPEEEEGED